MHANSYANLIPTTREFLCPALRKPSRNSVQSLEMSLLHYNALFALAKKCAPDLYTQLLIGLGEEPHYIMHAGHKSSSFFTWAINLKTYYLSPVLWVPRIVVDLLRIVSKTNPTVSSSIRVKCVRDAKRYFAATKHSECRWKKFMALLHENPLFSDFPDIQWSA